MPPIRFAPIYKIRPWGGRQLEATFQRTLPEGTIGESWELVDRHDDQSVVLDGPYAGLTLGEICQKHGSEILKEGWEAKKPFPLIVKWLDANKRLSLQVHPPADVARKHGSESKSECWTIVKAENEAGVFAGFKKGMTQAAFEAALKEKNMEDLLHRIHTQAGDFIFIPAGRLHTIDAGNLILEIQENSDTTYRVFDWESQRQTHIDKALHSINFNDFEPEIKKQGSEKEEKLLEHSLFSIKRLQLAEKEEAPLPALPTAQILSITAGEISCEGTSYQA